jgi:hypothetical protein
MHRDVMAGHNICNVVLGHLEHQERPLYLQPKAADGTYPWMVSRQSMEQEREASSSGKTAVRGLKRCTSSAGASNAGTSAAIQETRVPYKALPRRRKRAAPSDDDDENMQESHGFKKRVVLDDSEDQRMEDRQ